MPSEQILDRIRICRKKLLFRQLLRSASILILFSCPRGPVEAQTKPTTTSCSAEIRRLVSIQNQLIQASYPGSRLFQVFISNLVLNRALVEQKGSVEIHALFGSPSGRDYMEAIDRLRDPNGTQIVMRHFGGKDCFYGHPASQAESCGPTIQPPTKENEYLGLEWDLDSSRVASTLQSLKIDPSKYFDVTIVSAVRAMTTFRSSQNESSAYTDTIAQLSALKPTEAVLIITDISATRTGGSLTVVLRGTDQTYLATVPLIQPKRLPPSRL
jgi:hypothetical protein